MTRHTHSAAPHADCGVALQQLAGSTRAAKRKEKKEKDYAFRRQFNEKPSIIPGCPDGLQRPHHVRTPQLVASSAVHVHATTAWADLQH